MIFHTERGASRGNRDATLGRLCSSRAAFEWRLANRRVDNCSPSRRRRDFRHSRLGDFATRRPPIGPQLLNRPAPNRPYPLTLSLRSAFSRWPRFSRTSDLFVRLFQRFHCNAGSDTINPSNAYMEGCINGTRIYMQQHAAVMGGAGITVACLMVRSILHFYRFPSLPPPLLLDPRRKPRRPL